jgi:hypothetical protein
MSKIKVPVDSVSGKGPFLWRALPHMVDGVRGLSEH